MTHDERRGPPPVEPLSDAAWSRIERGVWAQLDAAGPPGTPDLARGARRWWLVATPLAAAAMVAIVLAGRAFTTDVGVTGEPSRVVSGTTPSAVSFGDAHVQLDADSALVLNHEAGHPVALLERGGAWFTVAPRRGRLAFIVRAGDASVRVVGTRFRVARSHEHIAVDVEHGLVDVQFRGRVTPVGARQRWSSETPAEVATVASAATDPIATPDPIAAPPPPTPAPTATSAPRPGPDPVRTPAARDGSGSTDLPGPSTDAAPGSNRDGKAADLDRAEYDRLATLEPASPEAALAGYLTLARGTSRWADPALFAAARLAVDLHDRRAATLLGIYLQRFPSGANATDARQLLARLKGNLP